MKRKEKYWSEKKNQKRKKRKEKFGKRKEAKKFQQHFRFKGLSGET